MIECKLQCKDTSVHFVMIRRYDSQVQAGVNCWYWWWTTKNHSAWMKFESDLVWEAPVQITCRPWRFLVEDFVWMKRNLKWWCSNEHWLLVNEFRNFDVVLNLDCLNCLFTLNGNLHTIKAWARFHCIAYCGFIRFKLIECSALSAEFRSKQHTEIGLH